MFQKSKMRREFKDSYHLFTKPHWVSGWKWPSVIWVIISDLKLEIAISM